MTVRKRPSKFLFCYMTGTSHLLFQPTALFFYFATLIFWMQSMEQSINQQTNHNIGMGFVGVQALAYNGYIEVDHGKIKQDVEGLLDLNGDGKLDASDRAIASEKMMVMLQHNMPSGGGFVAGFAGGLRSG
mmetsp:Transcript_27025/g.56600  ORF Transcript_27025/g.56600 Transcript_27025/m.56600 type:complete len:131 (+) Transcript_27025:493-885(+)